MDNHWDAYASHGFSDGGVSYTPGIELGEPYVHSVEELQSETGEGFVTAVPTVIEAANGRGPDAIACSTARRKQGTRRVPRREKNFTVKEDEMLCAAYLNVGKDPIVGCNQPSGGYWARIHEYYHEHKVVPSERSLSSLQHRWGGIQKDTTRFCGFYDQIQRRNESGKNDNDKLKDALEMFQGIVGSSFSYMHCWCILRYEKKWNDWLASLTQKDKAGIVTASPANRTSEIEEVQPSARPIGRDKAKKQRSQGSTSSSSTACLEVLQKISMDRSVYEERQEEHSRELLSRADRKLAAQERLAAAQERLAAAQEFEQEQRIMSIDVDKVVPWQREYYVRLQQQIIQKRTTGV